MRSASTIGRILGMRVDPLTYDDTVSTVIETAMSARSSYVCVANVHMVMEAHDDPSFRELVERALLVTPDGQPLVWSLKALGHRDLERVYGPTLTLHLCEAAERTGVPIALYGGTPSSMVSLTGFLKERFPKLRIACAITPPFPASSPEEDEAQTRRIVESGARLLLVGIGCPKQERWMAAHADRIPAVMIGVGATFDFLSGRVRQSPPILQRMGLEWVFRLAMEPARLWRRYVRHNPRFLWLFMVQWLRHVIAGRDSLPAAGSYSSLGDTSGDVGLQPELKIRSARRHRSVADRRGASTFAAPATGSGAGPNPDSARPQR